MDVSACKSRVHRKSKAVRRMRTGLYGETGCRLFGVRECDSSPSIFSQCSLQPSVNFARLSQRSLAESCHVSSVSRKARRHCSVRFTCSTRSAASTGAEPQTPNQLRNLRLPSLQQGYLNPRRYTTSPTTSPRKQESSEAWSTPAEPCVAPASTRKKGHLAV